jgi:hypothetical protein
VGGWVGGGEVGWVQALPSTRALWHLFCADTRGCVGVEARGVVGGARARARLLFRARAPNGRRDAPARSRNRGAGKEIRCGAECVRDVSRRRSSQFCNARVQCKRIAMQDNVASNAGVCARRV